MKINSGKSHMLFLENDNVRANIDDYAIISENKTELRYNFGFKTLF